jgi:hypothetical protein
MNNLLKKELQADADALATIAVRRCASVKKRKR